MTMKRLWAALLAAAMLLAMAAIAEEDDFGFDFSDEGYTGIWYAIEEMGVEFCLPDGWTPQEAGDNAAFEAAKDDGGATLRAFVAAEDVDDLVAWGDFMLEGYKVDPSGFSDTLYVETSETVAVYRLNDADQMMAFVFDRTSKDALSTEFALEIVSSVSESWTDFGVAFDDGEGGDALSDIEALENAG